jgi:endonuclease/exonuclease/phosphatase family metal-dependent hydrolase
MECATPRQLPLDARSEGRRKRLVARFSGFCVLSPGNSPSLYSVILSLRVIDLVAGATLVGVVGGGVVTVATDLGTQAYVAPVSSAVIDDPAPPTELVSADPYVAPGSKAEARTPGGARAATASGESTARTGRAVDNGAAARVAPAHVGGFAAHSGLATSAAVSRTAGTAGTSATSVAPVAAGTSAAPQPAAVKGPAPSGATRTVTTDVVVSSFNVLGASHTDGKRGRRGFAKGKVRAGYAAQAIQQRDVDLVGLQELERPQARTMVRRLPGYSIFPGPSKRRHASANSIMWRNDTWSAVAKHTIGIPYFKGNIINMPYVRLRNLATGTDVWVANFHNPASIKKRGDQSRWRADATRRQVDLANRLRAETKLPVIFTGDFNEREVYFCRLVGATELEASNGGAVVNNRCSPPRDARIDWVFGTPELDWQSHVVDKSSLIQRVTDHPMIVAKAKLRVAVRR